MAKLLDGFYKVENHVYKVLKVLYLSFYLIFFLVFFVYKDSSIQNFSRCQVRKARLITVQELNTL